MLPTSFESAGTGIPKQFVNFDHQYLKAEEHVYECYLFNRLHLNTDMILDSKRYFPTGHRT